MPNFVHWKARQQHRHWTLRQAIKCPWYKPNEDKSLHLGRSDETYEIRPITSDELTILGLTIEAEGPKSRGLNCNLTRPVSYKNKIPAEFHKKLPQELKNNLNLLDHSKQELLNAHIFLTLPRDYTVPNGRNRILAIDMIDQYQQIMAEATNKLLKCKLNLNSSQPTEGPFFITEKMTSSMLVPQYTISRPKAKELWRPTQEPLTQRDRRYYREITEVH